MASREHSCTRRALLGAAVAVPVVGAGGDASPSRSSAAEEEGAWSVALRALREAEAAVEGFERWAASPAGRTLEERQRDYVYEERTEEFVAAMLRLLRAPAPDIGAVAVKIGLIARHWVWELDGAADCMLWLEADARRLAGVTKVWA